MSGFALRGSLAQPVAVAAVVVHHPAAKSRVARQCFLRQLKLMRHLGGAALIGLGLVVIDGRLWRRISR